LLYFDTVPHFFPVLWNQRIARKGEVARAATSHRFQVYLTFACWWVCVWRAHWWVEKENKVPGNRDFIVFEVTRLKWLCVFEFIFHLVLVSFFPLG
jgi:hypothetical protein